MAISFHEALASISKREAAMDDTALVQKMATMDHDKLLALCGSRLVSKELVSAVNYTMSQRLEGGTPQQKFARHVSDGIGKALLAIEVASPGRDCFAEAAFHKRAPLTALVKDGASAKPRPDKGDGKQHLLGEDGEDFDSLLAQFHQKNPSMSLGRATEMFMHTPEGAAAYGRAKEKRLQKSAALMAGIAHA